MDIKKLSNEELIELVRPKRCLDHHVNLTPEDKLNILHELFNERTSDMDNEMLHSLLWSNLPPMPNGDAKLAELQHKLVAANPCKTQRSNIPVPISENYIMVSFRALVNSNIEGSSEVAKEAYRDLSLRGREDEIPDGDMYTFVRRLIPSAGDPNFRKVAEKMMQIIIENN